MKKIIIGFVVIIVSILFYNYLKDLENDLKTGTPVFNESIKDSKKNKNFVNEYIPSKKKLLLNGKTYLINEAWTEDALIYIKNGKKKLNFINFVISFNSKKINNIQYSREGYDTNGMGWIDKKIQFKANEKELTSNRIKLFFWIVKDTTSVVFTKK